MIIRVIPIKSEERASGICEDTPCFIALLIALALALLLIARPHPLLAQELLVAVDPPLAPGSGTALPVALGSGWNFGTSTAKPEACVTGTPSPDVPRSTYETAGEYTDASTLAEALKISAHAQASFIIGSGEAEASYALKHKAHVSGDRIAIYAGIHDLNALTPMGASASATLLSESATSPVKLPTSNAHLFGKLSLSPTSVLAAASGGIALKDKYLKVLTDAAQGLTPFEAKCGQGYVQATETGADLVGFYEFNTSDIDVQREVTGSLKGSILGQSASVSLDMLVSSVNNSSAQLIDYNQFGGSSKNLPIDKVGFLKALLDFPTTLTSAADGPKTSPKVFKLYVVPYGPDTVSNWPSGIQPSFAGQPTPLEQLIQQYWLLDPIYEQLGTVIDNPDDYILTWGTTLADVKNRQAEILDLQRKLHYAIETCDKSGPCAAPPLGSTQAYYIHLSRIPLSKTWSHDFSGLLSSFQRAQAAVSTYNKDHYDLVNLSQQGIMHNIYSPQADPTCYRRNDLSHKVMVPNYQQKVKPLLDDLRSRDQNLPQQLRQLLRSTIFEITNRARCGISRTAFGCANAPELDAWIQQMPLSGPHGVSTNEGDDHVYGECPPHDLSLAYSP